jgi:hypothetical protein
MQFIDPASILNAGLGCVFVLLILFAISLLISNFTSPIFHYAFHISKHSFAASVALAFFLKEEG